MRALIAAMAVSALALTPSLFFASPTVYPTGTTIYKPEKAWNGFTVYQTMAAPGAVLIDMNGNVRASWKHIVGFPVTILPGGYVMGGTVGRATRAYTHHLGSDDLVQEDWAGNVVWKFGKADQIEVDGTLHWSARQNHDFVREGAPVGYYVPGQTPKIAGGKTLILSQKTGKWP
ncbi:MAG: hypothetical protein ACHP85_06745, partial [Burkholderiales bacterium]